MIVDAILSALVSAVEWVLGLLPSFSPPDLSAFTSAVSDFRITQYISWANHFLPITLVGTLIVLRLTVWGASYAFEGVVWLLVKAHVLGGGE